MLATPDDHPRKSRREGGVEPPQPGSVIFLTDTGIRVAKWSGRRVTLPLGLAPEASASLLGYALKNPKRTESGFRPLLRPCGVSAGRLDSLGKVDGHEDTASSTPVWKTGVCLSTPMPDENKNGNLRIQFPRRLFDRIGRVLPDTASRRFHATRPKPRSRKPAWLPFYTGGDSSSQSDLSAFIFRLLCGQ